MLNLRIYELKIYYNIIVKECINQVKKQIVYKNI
jgi:hypothetical protein